MHRGEYEENVQRGDVETTRTSEIYIYIGASIVLQTQLRSGLYNSFLTRTPGSEGVRNKHIIQSCPTYEEYRTILRQASQTLYLPDLLGTKDGIQAMASFLEKSGAFTKNSHSPPTPSPPHITDRPLTDFIETDSQTFTQHESH